MGFNLNLSSGGDFLPIVKIDARAGRIFRVDRDDNGEPSPVDVTNSFEAAFDFQNGEAGWAYFQSGSAPDFVMVPIGEPLPPEPSKNYRQGVRLRIMLSSTAAGGRERLREVATTAKSVIRALEALYDQWLAGRGQNPGMTIVAKLAGVRPVISGGGGQRSTNYEPTFTVVRWVKAPAEFETPPRRSASSPNGGTGEDRYRAAKSGEEAAPGPATPPPSPPPAAEDDWG